MSLWICPKCVKLYPADTHICSIDGAKLELYNPRVPIYPGSHALITDIQDPSPHGDYNNLNEWTKNPSITTITKEEAQILIKELENTWLSPEAGAIISKLIEFVKSS